MSEAENKDVEVSAAIVTESAPVVSVETPAPIATPVASVEAKPAQVAVAKTAPAPKPRLLDKYQQRRAELKREKRVTHRRRIAASNTPG